MLPYGSRSITPAGPRLPRPGPPRPPRDHPATLAFGGGRGAQPQRTRLAPQDDLPRRHQARARAGAGQTRPPACRRAAAPLPPARSAAQGSDALDRAVPPELGGPLRSTGLAPRGDEVRGAISFSPPLPALSVSPEIPPRPVVSH